ncbi:MAG: leucine-rich repeat domain-containing protein [Oscillospiraceae bacterium]|nr:leucine-rich repeat domain-containing protein [Oscillospiraceae bacterium]
MKRIFALFLILALSVTALAACGGEETAESTASGAAAGTSASAETDEKSTAGTSKETTSSKETESSKITTSAKESETTDDAETASAGTSARTSSSTTSSSKKTTVTTSGTAVDSGSCGDDLEWTLYSGGTLEVSGSGEMEAFLGPDRSPWHDSVSDIEGVLIGEGVTEISMYAFAGCEELTEVSLPDSLRSIHDSAFRDCISLESITIPSGVTELGSMVFNGCEELTSVTFEGSAPEFGGSVFLYDTLTVYYPEGESGWNSDVMQLYGAADITWKAD